MKPIILIGTPGTVGGARTESGDTALLWRRMGIPVSVLPVLHEPGNPWTERLEKAGCKILPEIKPDFWPRQPWLFRSTVVDFATERAVRNWDRLARMGCKLVHVPCHCAHLPHEYDVFRHRPPTAVVFQSEFQAHSMSIQYARFGLPESRQFLIHGAFEQESWDIIPRGRRDSREPFWVGRIARDVPAKWPPELIEAMEQARKYVPIRGLFLGWTKAVEAFSGPLPDWIEAFPPGSQDVRSVLSRLHCLLCLNAPKAPAENWPRVGLEAMHAGVPIVADRRGGWIEMLQSRSLGFLVDSPRQAGNAIVAMAKDEGMRSAMIRAGQKGLSFLADEKTIGAAWRRVFASLDDPKMAEVRPSEQSDIAA